MVHQACIRFSSKKKSSTSKSSNQVSITLTPHTTSPIITSADDLEDAIESLLHVCDSDYPTIKHSAHAHIYDSDDEDEDDDISSEDELEISEHEGVMIDASSGWHDPVLYSKSVDAQILKCRHRQIRQRSVVAAATATAAAMSSSLLVSPYAFGGTGMINGGTCGGAISLMGGEKGEGHNNYYNNSASNFSNVDHDEIESVLGVMENRSLILKRCRNKSEEEREGRKQEYDEEYDGERIRVKWEVHRPTLVSLQENDAKNVGKCCCEHPKGDWNRPTTPSASSTSDDSHQAHSMPAVKIVDLTGIQLERKDEKHALNGDSIPKLDSNGAAFHLLRSILVCDEHFKPDESYDSIEGDETLHCASPWGWAYSKTRSKGCCCNDNGETKTENKSQSWCCPNSESVVGVLMLNRYDAATSKKKKNKEKENEWDVLEKNEIDTIRKLRTGDASPSYYLHSTSILRLPVLNRALRPEDDEDSMNNTFQDTIKKIIDAGGSMEAEDDMLFTRDENGVEEEQLATLLIFRHLPPRDHLTKRSPEHSGGKDSQDEGWRLWETYVPKKKKIEIDDENDDEDHDDDDDFEDDSDSDDDSEALDEAAWKRAAEAAAEQALNEADQDDQDNLQYRLVAPPYLSHNDIYPNLLKELVQPDNLQKMIQEARSIPKWTAWPERNHYMSASLSKNKNKLDNPESATWTVFPLCHTFPATDPNQRKFIDQTCEHVPQTVALLKQTLGSKLRTALFSRLDSQTKLEAHTGWSDLANHVLRVHIPLIVPGYDNNEGHEVDAGLCGTWVDGCVQTHEPGEIICFDDSKTHRAYNYTDYERIVLIIDLERPCSSEEGADGKNTSVPLGTATGGHTDELDKFIKQFS